jgi:hypothetical protein
MVTLSSEKRDLNLKRFKVSVARLFSSRQKRLSEVN